MKDNSGTNKLTIVLFTIYLIAIFWILVFKLGVQFSYMGNRNVNLIPFNEPLILDGKTGWGEIIMNMVIFVPLGIYAGILFKQWIWGKHLILYSLTSSIVEGLQYIFRIGAFDITDVITNTFGGIVGFMIIKAIKKVLKNNAKAQRLINMTAAIGTALMVLFLLLLKTNNLWIKYQ